MVFVRYTMVYRTNTIGGNPPLQINKIFKYKAVHFQRFLALIDHVMPTSQFSLLIQPVMELKI